MPTTHYRHLERTARLAYLAPDIVRAVIEGRNPKTLNARTLARLGSLPLGWREQRTLRSQLEARVTESRWSFSTEYAQFRPFRPTSVHP